MTEHYFSKKQSSPLNLQRIEARLRGSRVSLFTGSGVFSKDKVDRGSLLLIDAAKIDAGSSVLDLGCGYGPVGIAVKLFCPSCDVVMSDVNQRAVKLARKNCRLNGVDCQVVLSDGFDKIEQTFDLILLNPPQTAGKKVCFSLIENSKNHLEPNGRLQIVARHNKGGKSLSKKMKEVFGNVETLDKSGGFRVYSSALLSSGSTSSDQLSTS